MRKKMKAVVVGYGDRGEVYSNYALKHTDELEIVAVIDPDPRRRDLAAKRFNISQARQYSDVTTFLADSKIADFAINATMDSLHITTSLPLLEAGYDILLEKPIANNIEEINLLYESAQKYGRKVAICHVLRYTPFYKKIKQLISDGNIGEIITINAKEHVNVGHFISSFVRGKWGNSKECGSSFLLQKCCHDMDLLCWLVGSAKPQEIVSFGERKTFVPDCAPKGSTEKCMDCKYCNTCIYSAKKYYLDNDIMPNLVWMGSGKIIEDMTMDDKVNFLKISPFGRCVYKTDGDIYDRQNVMIKFSSGALANFTVAGGASRGGRYIHIVGSKGEIIGYSESGEVKLLAYPENGIIAESKTIDINESISGDGHGGGDYFIMKEVVEYFDTGKSSLSLTTLGDSLNSHKCVFAADKSAADGCVVKI